MSDAARLFEDLAARGIQLELDGDFLEWTAPRGALTPELLETMRQRKPELLALLRSARESRAWYRPPADPPPAGAGRPVDEAALDVVRSGRAVRVWSAVLEAWLYWVRDEDERIRLLERGCEGPIYTLGELAIVATGTSDDARNLHALKREFGAVIRSPRRVPAGDTPK